MRSLYGMPDMDERGKIRTTLTQRYSPINAANLKTAAKRPFNR